MIWLFFFWEPKINFTFKSYLNPWESMLKRKLKYFLKYRVILFTCAVEILNELLLIKVQMFI